MSQPSEEGVEVVEASQRPIVLPQPPRHVPLVHVRPPPVGSLPPDPGNPIQVPQQAEMLYWFTEEGYWGLAITLYTYAQQYLNAGSENAYWKVLIEDYSDGSCFLYYFLLSLPPYLIRSLIQNTLPYDIVHDTKVARFVRNYMSTATDAPGVYINIPARDVDSIAGQLVDDGKWLSGLEIRLMLAGIRDYLNITPATNQAAKTLDRYLHSNFASLRAYINDPALRRYAQNEKQKARLREWAVIIEKQYLQNLPVAAETQRFLRAPVEVGWSNNIDKRIAGHRDNSQTTHIFGYLHAWTRHVLPGVPKFPEAHHFTLFRLFKKSLPMAKVAELTGMLLTSSFYPLGGLNSSVAGNIRETSTWPHDDSPCWDNALQEMFSRGHIEDAIKQDAEIAARKREFIGMNGRFQALETRVAGLEDAIKAHEVDIQDAEDKKKKALAIREELGNKEILTSRAEVIQETLDSMTKATSRLSVSRDVQDTKSRTDKFMEKWNANLEECMAKEKVVLEDQDTMWEKIMEELKDDLDED